MGSNSIPILISSRFIEVGWVIEVTRMEASQADGIIYYTRDVDCSLWPIVSTDRTYPLLDIKKNNKIPSIGKKDHVKMRKIILYAADFLWLCENNPSLEIQWHCVREFFRLYILR